MTMMGVSVRILDRGAMVCRVRIAGEIDLATVGCLTSAFEHIFELLAPGELVSIDASAISFLSAGGVRVLARFADRLKTHGGELVIEEVSPAVDQVLRICGYAALMGVPRPRLPSS
jgi:anti-anti-sigma factor